MVALWIAFALLTTATDVCATVVAKHSLHLQSKQRDQSVQLNGVLVNNAGRSGGRKTSDWMLTNISAASLGSDSRAGAPPTQPSGCPVVVGIDSANKSRALPLLGFGTELVWQSTNDSGLLAAASVAAGSRVARYPGGTPSNYWDWSCSHGNKTCCTELSLARKEVGKCSGAMGQAPTKPAAWAQFVHHALRRATIFDLNVVQTNASYQLAGLKEFESLGVPVEFLEMGNELFDVRCPRLLHGLAFQSLHVVMIRVLQNWFVLAGVCTMHHAETTCTCGVGVSRWLSDRSFVQSRNGTIHKDNDSGISACESCVSRP